MSTPNALQTGSLIGAYKIEKVLATTPFGTLYRATPTGTDRIVNIQEFLPPELAHRAQSGAKVSARKGKELIFEEALTRFLQEARILAQIHDPYITRVHEYTEANGTAYLVMEYNRGRDLASHLLKHPEPIEEDKLRNILIPILKGLRAVHNAGLLHRDITPQAIYLRREGPPLLTWFGACHRAPEIECSLNHRVSPGFSPIELYHENSTLEPASDLYSLGAVMYRCIAGAPPVDPTQRLAALAQKQEDPLVPAMEIGSGSYSSAFLGTIDWMLQPMLQDRPDSASTVLGPLSPSNKPKPVTTNQVVPAPGPLIVEPEARTPRSDKRQSHRGWIWIFSIVAPLVVLWLASPVLKPLIFDTTTSKDHDGTAQATASKPAHDPASAAAVADKQPDSPATASIPDREELAAENLGDSALDDPPPQVPEKVVFARSGDDQRAQLYREIERTEKEQEQLLNQARAYIDLGDQSRALEVLRKLLALDPNNADAKESIARISDQLLTQARKAFSDKDIPHAERLVARVREITPDHFALDPLQRQLTAYRIEQQRLEEEKQRAEVERQNKIEELAQKAASAVVGGRYIEPAGNNALEHYRALLALEPGNAVAIQGIEKVAMAYLDRANRALAADDFSSTANHLVTAAAIQPDNPAIGLLREQLDARRKAATQRPTPPTSVPLTSPAAPQATPPPPAVKQVSRDEQKANEDRQNLRRGIEAYYVGAYDKARRLLSRLAEQGNARAQFRLGMMYYLGRGVVKNRLIAEDWVRKALPEVRRLAQLGEAWAQADLGSLYEDGLVVEPDSERAVSWYTRAAQQGYAGAQTNLGVMYARGIGVETNIVEAIRWLERAAAQGDRVARANLVTLRNQQQ